MGRIWVMFQLRKIIEKVLFVNMSQRSDFG